MPFCLVLNDNNASSFVTYDTFHPVTPHSPHEPIFLISDSLEEGRDLNNLAFYLASKEIKDKDNQSYIPNHIYLYLNAFHTDSSDLSLEEQPLYEAQRKAEKARLNAMLQVPAEERLYHQAERMGEDIISKLSDSENQKPCLIVAISWESTKALLIAEYLVKRGYLAPFIYLIDGIPHEYAHRMFTQNNSFATKEILALINRAAELCSLNVVDYIDIKNSQHSTDENIDNLPFKYRFNSIMEFILEKNNLYEYRLNDIKDFILEKYNLNSVSKSITDKRKTFKKYVTIIQNNLCNMINHPISSISFKKNIRLLFTQEICSKFADETMIRAENNFGWGSQVAQLNLINDKNEIVYSLNQSLLLGADHVQQLASSIRTIYDELTLTAQINRVCDLTIEVKRVCEKLKGCSIVMDEQTIKKMEEALLTLRSINIPLTPKLINNPQLEQNSHYDQEADEPTTDILDSRDSPGDELYCPRKRKSLESSNSDNENVDSNQSSAEKTPSGLLLNRMVPSNSINVKFFKSRSASSSNTSPLNSSGEDPSSSKNMKSNLNVS